MDNQLNEWLRFTLSPSQTPVDEQETDFENDYCLVAWIQTHFDGHSFEVKFINSEGKLETSWQSEQGNWTGWINENGNSVDRCEYTVDVAVPVDKDALSEHGFGYLQAFIFELDFNLLGLFESVNETSKTVAMRYGCTQRPADAHWVQGVGLWPGFTACLEFDGDAQHVFRHGYEGVELPAIDFPPEDD